jgi:protein-S-isoprenylcysteine O-methyltransferase Ste14
MMHTIAGIAWLVFLLVWGIGAFTSKRDARRLPAGSVAIHVAVLALGMCLLFVRALRVGPLGWRILPDRDWVEWTGATLQVLGIALCIWARLYLGRNWSSTVTLKEGHALVRGGPYGLVRHPIYSGLLLAMLGVAVDRGKLAGAVGFVILLFEWKRKSLLEEGLMLEQFGDGYQRYREEVKGLIPGVW